MNKLRGNKGKLMWLNLFKNPLILGVAIMLIVAAISDLNTRKIPNSLIVFGLVASLVCQEVALQGAGTLNWLAGVAVGFVCFIPLYVLRGMAAGDVKLMMAVGGFLGYPLIFKAVACVFISGGVMALIFILAKGRLRLLTKNMRVMWNDFYIKATSGVNVADDYVMKNSVGRMPYALAIAIGTAIAVYLQASAHSL